MDVEKLISLVHSKPPLWNQAHPDHQNRFVVGKLWDGIAAEMNVNRNIVAKKWKYLRDYMRNEIAKLPKKRSGDAGGTIVKSSWQFYPLMLFLKDQLANRKSDGNLRCSQASTEPDEIVEESCESQAAGLESQNSEVIMEESQNNQQMTEDLPERAISLSPRAETVEEPRVALATRKRSRTNEVYGKALLNIEKEKLEYLKQKMSKKSTIPESNDDKMFFESLLPFVSKIPSHEKLLFRSQVQELVQKFAFNRSLDVSPNDTSTEWNYTTNTGGHSTSLASPSSPLPTSSESQNMTFWLSTTENL